MIRRPPRSTRTDTLFAYTTLCRSVHARRGAGVRGSRSYPSISEFRRHLVVRAAPRHLHARSPQDSVHQEPPLLRLEMHVVMKVVAAPQHRSAGRRVGKECVSTCRSGWSQSNVKKETNKLKVSHKH